MKASGSPDPIEALASSFSLTEKSSAPPITQIARSRRCEYDERNRTDILAVGFNPRFRLPIIGKDDSGLWKLVTHHSGATALDSHEVPCIRLQFTGINARFQRAALELNPALEVGKKNSWIVKAR